MVTSRDRVLLTGSRSILGRPWGEKRMPSPSNTGHHIHQDLVDEPPPQALAGHVGAEDLQVLPARSVQRRGDRCPDIAAEERDLRVRRVRRLVGQDEERSGER